MESDHYRMLMQHDKDLYHGNGKPGLTTRVLALEETMKAIKFYGRGLLVLVAGILVTAIVNLVVKK